MSQRRQLRPGIYIPHRKITASFPLQNGWLWKTTKPFWEGLFSDGLLVSGSVSSIFHESSLSIYWGSQLHMNRLFQLTAHWCPYTHGTIPFDGSEIHLESLKRLGFDSLGDVLRIPSQGIHHHFAPLFGRIFFSLFFSNHRTTLGKSSRWYHDLTHWLRFERCAFPVECGTSYRVHWCWRSHCEAFWWRVAGHETHPEDQRGGSKDTVDGSKILRSPVQVGSLSHYLQCFIDLRWCRISAIDSSIDAAFMQSLAGGVRKKKDDESH